MGSETDDYQSFLLRLWRVQSAEAQPVAPTSQWRASLESVKSAETIGFDSLQELFDYLQRITAAGAGEGGTPADRDSITET